MCRSKLARSNAAVAYKHPLYVSEDSKRLLRLAIHNDSLFLANLQVMDYSLACAVDTDRQELVVGIIGAFGATASCSRRRDYIRTFTLDKRLESWVKSTGKGAMSGGEPC